MNTLWYVRKRWRRKQVSHGWRMPLYHRRAEPKPFGSYKETFTDKDAGCWGLIRLRKNWTVERLRRRVLERILSNV